MNKLQNYSNPEKDTQSGKPKNNNLIASIDSIELAVLESSFWFGDKSSIPYENPTWCEVWLSVNNEQYTEVEDAFCNLCSTLNIGLNMDFIRFPERLVKLVFADAKHLTSLIQYSPSIAEIRRAPETSDFFVSLTNVEQNEFAENLLNRLNVSLDDVSICILDTGVNNGHKLLNKNIPDDVVQTVNPNWSINDDAGHGTCMAGVALYNDLKSQIISDKELTLSHFIESVKILPPSNDNKPELYGAITRQAVSKAEIVRPSTSRVHCMAITTDELDIKDGSPTSWSAAIDSITSGAIDNDEKRLFFISAGNVSTSEIEGGSFPEANYLHAVESPGQSWNAISVGAFTKDILIKNRLFEGYVPVAEANNLSPFSSTSITWDSKWPIKPEILLDGGNMATDGTNCTECDDLSLLTTNYEPTKRLFTIFHGTSSATAQASWMASQLLLEYPNMWPETVRALLIHSADWTSQMKNTFCKDDKKSTGRRNLLRCCGYGIPNIEKAKQCFNNSVNMIIEDELQPFKKDGSSYKMNEMHIHELPWPKNVLLALGEIEVTMKVTLSYFIEPGPGEIGWKDKYRYPSCSLRFDTNNSDETKEDFQKRINIMMREEKDDKGSGTSGSDNWFLGQKNRNVGSIHSDSRTQSAVELCDCNYISVYPVIGWWRERHHLGKYNKKIRYSLVVSLSTQEISTDFYTPIVTKIHNAVKIPTEIYIQTL